MFAVLAVLIALQTQQGAAQMNAPSAELVQYRAARSEAAHRPRRIIFNNDGDDHLIEGPTSVEAFLAERTTPLLGSQVDTIVYCTSRPFGMFCHNSKVGDALTDKTAFAPDRNNVVGDFIQQGTDPLKVMIDCCRRNELEVLWSMRMNDTHDAYHPLGTPQFYWSTFKEQHPELLFGTREKGPKYGSWSAVDFASPIVRDFLFRVFEEICRDYDVDGIEMDFFRHLIYFRSVANGGLATPEEREMMTDLMRRVRAMTEAEGMRKGKPILVTIRVPDSLGYCMGMGLDVEKWMQEGLVDVMVAAGDFRLNQWEYSTELGKRYGVPVWCDLDPSIPYGLTKRFDRNSLQAYRGRAMEAWSAGASGIYLFNCFNPHLRLWWELGDPAGMAQQDKFYYVNVMGTSGYLRATHSLPGGAQYEQLPPLHPNSPLRLTQGQTAETPLMVGETITSGQATLHLCAGVSRPPKAWLNGQELQGVQAEETWFDYPVDPALVVCGENRVRVAPADQAGDAPEWNVDYTCGEEPPAPWAADRHSGNTLAQLQDGALLIADRGTEPGSYLYYAYPWSADPDALSVAEFRAKVISGRSGVIICSGRAEEEVRLYPDRVEACHAEVSKPMDTTAAFHLYRVEIQGNDLRVFVDGELAVDAAGKFTFPAHDGRNSIMFGASSSPTMGEALWESIRFRTGTVALHDVVLTVRHGDAGQ